MKQSFNDSGARIASPRTASRGVGLPPVLILNLFYSGLAIARDFAGSGVRVIGLSSRRNVYGNFTRHCEIRFTPDSRDEPAELAEFLVRQAGELGGGIIFPTRDLDLVFLDQFREELAAHYRLALPSRASLMQVLDKQALARAAQLAGIPVPRTFVLSSEEEVSGLAGEIEFPCVVKPVSSHQWRGGDNWEKVGGRKAFLVETLDELQSEYRRVRTAHPAILVQEWVPGTTEDIVIVGAYVGENAEPRAYFTARKVLQIPDDFGTGCIVQSEPIGDIVEPTLRLWRELDYRGMAEVEYKYDQRTREYKLIEMNARHWDQHELSRAAGANLSVTAYNDLVSPGVSLLNDKRSIHPAGRVKWIAEDELFFFALQSIYHGGFRPKRFWRWISGPRILGIFAWSDPWPFIRYCFTSALPEIGKKLLEKVRNRKG
jgi:predicted ATP-grasp superfamily ATP-dependent carboligase